MFDTILAITVQHLDDVDRIALAIIPVQLADLFLVVEEVQPALAAAATTSTDLTDAVRGDGDFIDLVFGEGLSAVVGVVEFTTFDNGVSDGDLALLQVVPDVERDPLVVHGAGCRHLE